MIDKDSLFISDIEKECCGNVIKTNEIELFRELHKLEPNELCDVLLFTIIHTTYTNEEICQYIENKSFLIKYLYGKYVQDFIIGLISFVQTEKIVRCLPKIVEKLQAVIIQRSTCRITGTFG